MSEGKMSLPHYQDHIAEFCRAFPASHLVVKEDGSIAARNIIARLGKGQLRTDAALREQVLDVLVVHRHLIPTARRGHYMMVVPHD